MLKYPDAQVIVLLSSSVNLSTNRGHDSLNLTDCEMIRPPTPIIIDKVRIIEIKIAIILLILNFTKKLTTGLSNIAIMIENTMGIMMLWPTYNIVVKATSPTQKIDAFAKKGI